MTAVTPLAFDLLPEALCARIPPAAPRLLPVPCFDPGRLVPEEIDLDRLSPTWTRQTTTLPTPGPGRGRAQHVHTPLEPIEDYTYGIPSLVIAVSPTRHARSALQPRTTPSHHQEFELPDWPFQSQAVQPLPRRAAPSSVVQGEYPWAATPRGAWAVIPPPTLATPTVSAGGSLTALTTYYYVVTALTAAGETTASSEQSATTGATDLTVNLSWGAVDQATGYRVYRGTVSGTHGTLLTQTTSTTYVDDGTASLGSKSPPSTNTAGVGTDFELAVFAWSGGASGGRTAHGGRGSVVQLFDVSRDTVEFIAWGLSAVCRSRSLPSAAGVQTSQPFNDDDATRLTFLTVSAAPTRAPRRGSIGQGEDALWNIDANYIASTWIAWHTSPQPVPCGPRPMPSAQVPGADTSWVLEIEDVRNRMQVTWLSPSTTQSRPLYTRGYATHSLAELPISDGEQWVVWMQQQPQAPTRELPRVWSEHRAEPSWYSSGATIIVSGPYVVAATDIITVGWAVAGQVIGGGG